MLNQLIYTRSSPHRDLKNNAQVVRGDGFGVFAVSEGLTHIKDANYDFLLTRLAVPNCSRENSSAGLVHSYDYISLGGDMYAFSFEFARPHCREPRKNGKTHRAGTYIKQCFIGSISGYPFYWFGSPQWNAYLKSENDYYMDTEPNPVPEMLPEIDSEPQTGSISEEDVREFVLNGRGKTLVEGVWFLLHEYEKPEEQRKVLLIKDEPKNVELWIAAINYALPQELARKITFSTNRSKLGTQADKELFYYTDENGRFSTLQNRSTNQQRHPYNMIVGYHPKDVYCASLRQTPNSNYTIIDGVQKTSTVTVDESVNQPYYKAIEKFGKDLFDFCGAVMPGINPDNISSEISDMFSAYKYLMSSDSRGENWKYDYAFEAFSLLTKYGVPTNPAVCTYLLSEGLESYKRLGREDSHYGCRYLMILYKIAAASNHRDMIINFFERSIKNEIRRIDAEDNALTGIWAALKTEQLKEIRLPLLIEVFSDDKLKAYSHMLKNASDDILLTVGEMFLTLCESRYSSLSEILRSKEQYSFLCYTLMAAIDWPFVRKKLLAIVGRSPRLFNATLISIEQRLEKKSPEKMDMWISVSAEAVGRSALDISIQIAKSGAADRTTAEKILAGAVRNDRGYTRESMNAAMNLIQSDEELSGGAYFCACAEVCPPGEMDRLIELIMVSNMSEKAQKAVFNRIDSIVSFDPPEGFTKAGFFALKKWSEQLGITSKSCAYYDLRRKLSSDKREQIAAESLSSFLILNEPLKNGFIESRCFRELATNCAGICQSEVHILFLCMFVYEDERLRRRFTDAYVSCIFRLAHSGDVLKSLLNLCEPFVYEYKIRGRTEEEVNVASDYLEKSVRGHLKKVHLPQLEEKLAKYTEYDDDVKRTLLELCRAAGSTR